MRAVFSSDIVKLFLVIVDQGLLPSKPVIPQLNSTIFRIHCLNPVDAVAKMMRA